MSKKVKILTWLVILFVYVFVIEVLKFFSADIVGVYGIGYVLGGISGVAVSIIDG